MSVLQVEATFSWVMVLLYALSFVGFAAGIFWEKWRRPALLVLVAAFVLHTVLLAWRWYEVAHGPYVTRYEVFSSNAWTIVGLYLLVGWRWRDWLRFGVGPSGAALLFLLLALERYERVPGIPTAYHYFWLAVHIIFTKLALASIFIAVGAALVVLFKGEEGRAREFIFRFTGLALCFWTVAVAAGSVWAHIRWGRFWGWDPIETWSLIVWLGLGTSLHLQKTLGWRGRRAAWLTVFMAFLFVFVLVLLPFFTRTLHTMYLLGGRG